MGRIYLNNTDDRIRRGFTFVEILMALAIAAGVIAVSVLGYSAVSQASARHGAYGTVTLPLGVLSDFYGQTGTSVDAYFAPNYGRVTKAEELRDLLYRDISQSSAVFCLGRTLRSSSSQRPNLIPISDEFDARRLDTAAAFTSFLAAAVPDTDGYFTAYRGASTSPALSIFLLRPYTSTSIQVQAIYEVDFVTSTDPNGTYASVRRYQNGQCTDYYDVFYPASGGTVAFSPLVVQFERRARQATVEADYTLVKAAANRPFYFVWWPDPASSDLFHATEGSYTTSEPQSLYPNMADRTSLFMVIPMFPAL